MYVRGSNNASEYNRNDQAFYKGIVVKNNDPLQLHRVKIFVPELSNQPLEGWLQEYKRLNFRFPGVNNKEDVWADTTVFEEIATFLPWAESCNPLIGENSPARYHSPEQEAVMTDGNYEDEFRVNDEEAVTLKSGSFSPAFLFESFDTTQSDAFINPANNFCCKSNPYAFMYRPSANVNKAKGVFSVPSVGSKVWVFLYQGDQNFPVYIGGRNDYRESALINNMDNEESISLDYPNQFENKPKENA